MLPDWPELKGKLNHTLSLHVQKRVSDRLEEPLKQIKRVPVFEGNRNTNYGSDGFVHEAKMQKKEITGKIKKSVANVTFYDVLVMIEEMAEGIAEQQSKMVFTTLSDVCDTTGNVIDAKKEETALDIVLACLEKVDIDFDENGKIKKSFQFVNGMEAHEKFVSAFEDLKHDAEMRTRFNKIMEKKKADWNARQAARKLVG